MLRRMASTADSGPKQDAELILQLDGPLHLWFADDDSVESRMMSHDFKKNVARRSLRGEQFEAEQRARRNDG